MRACAIDGRLATMAGVSGMAADEADGVGRRGVTSQPDHARFAHSRFARLCAAFVSCVLCGLVVCFRQCFLLGAVFGHRADGADDLGSLSSLNEPCILYNVARRFADRKIYTYAGSVLIAVN